MNKYPLSLNELASIGGYGGIVFSVMASFGWSASQATAGGVLTFGLLAVALAQARIWERSAQLRFLTSRQGRIADDMVAAANTHIQVTHFSAEEPSAEYIERMRSRIAENVSVLRILPADAPRPAWLHKFDELKGRGYEEKRVSWKLPFDVTIVDGRKVVLFFPNNQDHPHYTGGVCIESEHMARLLEHALQRMERLSHPRLEEDAA